MFKLIIFVILYFIERVLAYKYIKRIDKKERLKVNKIESDHYKTMQDNMEAFK